MADVDDAAVAVDAARCRGLCLLLALHGDACTAALGGAP